jgi:hypothetical protein
MRYSAGSESGPNPPSHVEAWLRLRAGQCRPRHQGPAGLAWAQKHPAHGALYRTRAGQVQKLLARLGSRSPLIVSDASFPGRTDSWNCSPGAPMEAEARHKL